MAANHNHDAGTDEHQLDWFSVLDVAVWAAVVVIGVLAAEFFFGLILRERIARGASRYLRKQPAASEAAE